MISHFISAVVSVVSFQLKADSSSSSVYRNSDKTAMNKAQLLMGHGDSYGLMIGPPSVRGLSGPKIRIWGTRHPASSHLLEMRAAICG